MEGQVRLLVCKLERAISPALIQRPPRVS